MDNVLLAPDVQAQQQQLDQRRAIAQALLQQGMQQQGGTQMAGNVAIRNSPVTGLGNMLAAYLGGKATNDINQQQSTLNQQRREAMISALKGGLDQSNSDQTGAIATLASNPDTAPYAQEMYKNALAIKAEQAKPKDLPNDVREAAYMGIDLRTPEGRAQWQDFKKGQARSASEGTPYKVPRSVMINGVPTEAIVDARTGEYTLPKINGVTVGTAQYDPTNHGAIAAATAEGTAKGGAKGTAETTYGQMANNVAEIDKQISQLSNHPGLSGIVGVRGAIPNFPGLEAADAQARLEQLQGGVFMQARQALKGGGQITDYEGMKAEQAYGRMQKAQSKEAFQEALQDYKTHIHKGLELLANQSQGQFGTPVPAQAAPQRFKFNPATGQLE